MVGLESDRARRRGGRVVDGDQFVDVLDRFHGFDGERSDHDRSPQPCSEDMMIKAPNMEEEMVIKGDQGICHGKEPSTSPRWTFLPLAKVILMNGSTRPSIISIFFRSLMKTKSHWQATILMVEHQSGRGGLRLYENKRRRLGWMTIMEEFMT